MARLQKAAEAFKQLNQRKKGKKKGKKGPAGAGQGVGGAGQGRGVGADTGVEVGSPVATEWSKAQSQRVGNARRRPDPPGQRRAGQAHPPTPCPEGVLTLRARPPSEAEFVDCFRKTKLAINLLVSTAARPVPPSCYCGWGALSLAPPHRSACSLPTGQAAEAHPES